MLCLSITISASIGLSNEQSISITTGVNSAGYSLKSREPALWQVHLSCVLGESSAKVSIIIYKQSYFTRLGCFYKVRLSYN
jgi:hypothetical protein